MPAPKTTHVDPGSTFAVFIAAPSPVERPHAKRTCVLERRLGVDLRQRDLRHDRVLRERGRPHEVTDRVAVPPESRRPVGQVALVLLLADGQAEVRSLAAAVHTLAALRREERDDVIARGERRDVRADLLDHAGALVPENGRRVAGGVCARGRVEIGMAHPAGDEANERLARARLGELDLLHDERRAEFLEDGGADLHGGSLA
jgi:hypothetical protein